MKNAFLKLKTLPLLFIALLDEMGYGLIIPLLAPQIIYSPQGILSAIESASSRHLLYGLITAVYSICSMLSAPVWGKLSDTHGRKLILLLALFGSLLGFSLYIVSFIFHQISLFIFARIITGVTAGSIAVALAGVLDFSEQHNKLKQLSYFFVILTIALVSGPLVGGLLITSANSNISIQPFLLSITMLLLAMLILKFYFNDNNVRITTSKKSFTAIFNSLKKTKILNIGIILVLLELAWSLYFASIILFLVKAFQFQANQIALFITALGLSMCIGLTFVFNRLTKILSYTQQIISGFLSATLCLCAAGLTASLSMHWILGMLIALLVGSSFMAIIASYLKYVVAEHHGLMMGLLVNLISLAWIITALLSSMLSYYNLSLPFYISAGFLSMGMILVWIREHEETD